MPGISCQYFEPFQVFLTHQRVNCQFDYVGLKVAYFSCPLNNIIKEVLLIQGEFVLKNGCIEEKYAYLGVNIGTCGLIFSIFGVFRGLFPGTFKDVFALNSKAKQLQGHTSVPSSFPLTHLPAANS